MGQRSRACISQRNICRCVMSGMALSDTPSRSRGKQEAGCCFLGTHTGTHHLCICSPTLSDWLNVSAFQRDALITKMNTFLADVRMMKGRLPPSVSPIPPACCVTLQTPTINQPHQSALKWLILQAADDHWVTWPPPTVTMWACAVHYF